MIVMPYVEAPTGERPRRRRSPGQWACLVAIAALLALLAMMLLSPPEVSTISDHFGGTTPRAPASPYCRGLASTYCVAPVRT